MIFRKSSRVLIAGDRVAILRTSLNGDTKAAAAAAAVMSNKEEEGTTISLNPVIHPPEPTATLSFAPALFPSSSPNRRQTDKQQSQVIIF
jgi:hypothetical protein